MTDELNRQHVATVTATQVMGWHESGGMWIDAAGNDTGLVTTINTAARCWNPLEDDCQALRLLRMYVATDVNGWSETYDFGARGTTVVLKHNWLNPSRSICKTFAEAATRAVMEAL